MSNRTDSRHQTSITADPLTLFERKFFQRSKALLGARVLVAVSGGRDSVALLALLAKLRRRLRFHLGVAYVHHGAHPSQVVLQMRRKAYDLVKEVSYNMSLPFYCEVPLNADGSADFSSYEALFPKSLRSEAELRSLRRTQLEMLRVRHAFDYVALAHHHDDLLETRLIRLIRGTGPEGLLAMAPLRGTWWRPLLSVHKQQLRVYAENCGYGFLDDPTNDDTGPLRNWLRKTWLPQLESRRTGAVLSLARSLESLVCEVESRAHTVPSAISDQGVDRLVFALLDEAEQRRTLAHYLRHHLQAKAFSRAQLEELRKRLDTPRKNLTFELARLIWTVNAGHVHARPREAQGGACS